MVVYQLPKLRRRVRFPYPALHDGREKNSQSGLAVLFCVSALSSYENCVHAPDLMMLSRLAEFYDVTTDYLLGRTEYRCPPEALRRAALPELGSNQQPLG